VHAAAAVSDVISRGDVPVAAQGGLLFYCVGDVDFERKLCDQLNNKASADSLVLLLLLLFPTGGMDVCLM
jgi:hypothetical protein